MGVEAFEKMWDGMKPNCKIYLVVMYNKSIDLFCIDALKITTDKRKTVYLLSGYYPMKNENEYNNILFREMGKNFQDTVINVFGDKLMPYKYAYFSDRETALKHAAAIKQSTIDDLQNDLTHWKDVKLDIYGEE